jgi:hypothetical protein
MGDRFQLCAFPGIERRCRRVSAVDPPAERRISRPNLRTIASKAGKPGAVISRAIRSASTTASPSRRNIRATVLFPVPMPPVRPNTLMAGL